MACHIPAACVRVCTMTDKFTSQSTSSVPRAHFRINFPDTCWSSIEWKREAQTTLIIFRSLFGGICDCREMVSTSWGHLNLTFLSFKQLELSVIRSTRSAHPIREMAGLGVSVMGKAGFGWSGLFGRRTGDVCTAGVMPRPKPAQHLNK